MKSEQSNKQGGTPAVGSTAWLEQLTAEAYEVGRKIAAGKNPGYGYERKWPEICLASQAGFRAMVRFIVKRLRSNSMFGPKSPAERAVPRDSMISWANDEPAGGYCQHVNFGQNAPQTKPLGWGHGWGSSPRRCALERQWVEGANASS